MTHLMSDCHQIRVRGHLLGMCNDVILEIFSYLDVVALSSLLSLSSSWHAMVTRHVRKLILSRRWAGFEAGLGAKSYQNGGGFRRCTSIYCSSGPSTFKRPASTYPEVESARFLWCFRELCQALVTDILRAPGGHHRWRSDGCDRLTSIEMLSALWIAQQRAVSLATGYAAAFNHAGLIAWASFSIPYRAEASFPVSSAFPECSGIGLEVRNFEVFYEDFLGFPLFARYFLKELEGK
eukprot:NODE_3006_length_1067_cov_71.864440_g2758_i0.p1 GENE.NODE_3006_length_1067_cov_71.864440_g2758_i0~~NODE_3006_length_1067_cov_71.864440_g2758_i0.p1  ORF type:complete len:262 (+),score=18.37 NODE_3006_length_1067_cov_71.864440_g2758_i0:77-787(+)